VGRERRKVWVLRGGVFGEGNGGGGNNKTNVHQTEGEDNNSGREGQEPGRKLPEGVHGAHGSFNRLQWRLDGRGMLVDELGRTESEAEEEERVERGGSEVDGAKTNADEPGEAGTSPRPVSDIQPESKDEEIEIEFLDRHLGIKPMWLLRFFTSWGARWSAATANASPATGGTSEAAVTEDAEEGVDSDETAIVAGHSEDGDGDLNPREGDREHDVVLSTNGDGSKVEELEELSSS
jgi:hypothetical protein